MDFCVNFLFFGRSSSLDDISSATTTLGARSFTICVSDESSNCCVKLFTSDLFLSDSAWNLNIFYRTRGFLCLSHSHASSLMP
ncbi:hypothetical protein ENUP19_0055G0025 [Entamoeba nuttalli]|uniref:Uncharacterized protein n=1 Tax=Entamoeba nuttalli TaxID=412467 RepID=A0ABQ0DCK1_9EUKA